MTIFNMGTHVPGMPLELTDDLLHIILFSFLRTFLWEHGRILHKRVYFLKFEGLGSSPAYTLISPMILMKKMGEKKGKLTNLVLVP